MPEKKLKLHVRVAGKFSFIIVLKMMFNKTKVQLIAFVLILFARVPSGVTRCNPLARLLASRRLHVT